MITGTVRGREARIRLAVRAANGQEQEIDAVVDTGYTAWLTMPSAMIPSLGLPWHSVGSGILADGSRCLFDVFEATVIWDGRARRVFVDDADTTPLVGMALMDGYELNVEIRLNGNVRLKSIV
jgi:clan AA aspartic protease